MNNDGAEGPISVGGLPVERVVDAQTTPAVTHGRFELANHTDRTLEASVATVVVATADGSTPVDEFHIYALPDYEELHPRELRIPPTGRIEVEVSFAGRPAAPAADPAVEVEVTAGGRIVRARSPVTLVVRTRGPRSDG